MSTLPRRTLWLTLAAFALALFVCTFFLGDIGVFNDDYFCNQRDPITGQITALVMNRPWHLWRPLTRVVLTPLVTTLWPYPWALHAIDALLHAAIVALVYALLRRFGTRAGIAAPVALGFMVYPVHFEAVLWIAITCTLMSVVLMLAVWHIYLAWLARAEKWPGLVRLGALLALGALAYASAAFNEQPAGALAALPFAPLVVGLANAPTRWRRVVRSALPVLAVVVALGIYLRGFFHHMPGSVRAASKVGAVGSLPHHLGELLTKVPRELVLYRFAVGAFHEGWSAIGAHPATSAVAFGLLGLLGVAWCLRRVAPIASDQVRPDNRGRPTLIALGLAWTVGAWLPVAASHSITSPRLHYVSSMGLAIIVAAVCSLWGARVDRATLAVRRAWIVLCRAAFCAGVAGSLVVWIGVQANFQRRCAADAAEIEPIARVFGPSLPTGTYLIPVHIESHTASTGSQRFDDYFVYCWYWEFASGWRAQSALHRGDIYSITTGGGVSATGLWLDDQDPEHVGLFRMHLAFPVAPDFVRSVPKASDHPRYRRLPWDRALFFDVEGAGNTRFYTKLRLHIPGQVPHEIVPLAIMLAPLGTNLPERILDIFPVPPRPKPSRPGADPVQR